jgi:hypothetical protein
MEQKTAIAPALYFDSFAASVHLILISVPPPSGPMAMATAARNYRKIFIKIHQDSN